MKNNTTNLMSTVAVLIAAALVVGTFATVAAVTQQSAFAVPQKKPGHDGSKKKTTDNGSGNGNGNTVTTEECKNRGSASGFDTALDQECENLICTHPGENATCVQEGAAVQQGNQTTPTKLTCEQCFTKFLKPGQITIVVSSEAGLADLCLSLEQGRISETALIRQLNVAGVSETIQAQLIQCLIDAGLPFEPLIV
jgi:hypothetical protein